MSVNKTTFPTQELRAHKAPMSRYTGSSVGSLAQAPWPEQPAFSAHALPLPTPPYQSSLCSWGCWGWSPIPGLWLLRRQRLKDEFRSARKKRGLKADDKRGLWALLWDRERSPAPTLTGCGSLGKCLPLSGLYCPHPSGKSASSANLGDSLL